jgi:hypothetical protein
LVQRSDACFCFFHADLNLSRIAGKPAHVSFENSDHEPGPRLGTENGVTHRSAKKRFGPRIPHALKLFRRAIQMDPHNDFRFAGSGLGLRSGATALYT